MPAGMRPYMEDRSAVVASFTPQSAAGGPMRDGVLRSFAAIYDGHNGAHSATYCSTRCGALGSAAAVCRTAAAQRNATDMRDSLPMQCCMPMGPSPCLLISSRWGLSGTRRVLHVPACCAVHDDHAQAPLRTALLPPVLF